MKPFRKTKELYLRPSIKHIAEIIKPMGWSVETVENNEYPYNTTDVYLIHSVTSAVLSDTICQLLTTWLYEYKVTRFRNKPCINLVF